MINLILQFFILRGKENTFRSLNCHLASLIHRNIKMEVLQPQGLEYVKASTYEIGSKENSIGAAGAQTHNPLLVIESVIHFNSVPSNPATDLIPDNFNYSPHLYVE